jgi:hypothetical protein
MFESQNDGAAVNHHQPERTSNPPFVVDVIGEVAPNGKAIGPCIQRNEQVQWTSARAAKMCSASSASFWP